MVYEVYDRELGVWKKVREEDFKPGDVIAVDDPAHIRELLEVNESFQEMRNKMFDNIILSSHRCFSSKG